MRVLLVHPSVLMCSELFLRWEPLGLERVTAAVRDASHPVPRPAGYGAAGVARGESPQG